MCRTGLKQKLDPCATSPICGGRGSTICGRLPGLCAVSSVARSHKSGWSTAMTTRPLVSVVLSVHNGAADLAKAVDTILAQTFSDFELIAINNGSTDGTGAVLNGLRDPRVRVIHQDDMGFPAALNPAIPLPPAPYVAPHHP